MNKKRTLLALISSLFILSGCGEKPNNDTKKFQYIEAYYTVGNSKTERNDDYTIHFGERFDVKFKVYGCYTSTDKKEIQPATGSSSAGYFARYINTTSSAFNGQNLDVGSYQVEFSYDSLISTLSFSVAKANAVPTGASVSLDDFAYTFDNAPEPTLVFTDTYVNPFYEYVPLEAGEPVGDYQFYSQYSGLMPGEYRLRATINCASYEDFFLYDDFVVSKADFPTDIYNLELSPSYPFSFQYGKNNLGDYEFSPGNIPSFVRLSDSETEFDPDATFTWENPNIDVRTNIGSQFTTNAIFSCPRFNDYVVEINVVFSRMFVIAPYNVGFHLEDNVLTNSVTYDGEPHTIEWDTNYDETNEDLLPYEIVSGSTLTATNAGTYSVTFRLKDPTNTMWGFDEYENPITIDQTTEWSISQKAFLDEFPDVKLFLGNRELSLDSINLIPYEDDVTGETFRLEAKRSNEAEYSVHNEVKFERYENETDIDIVDNVLTQRPTEFPSEHSVYISLPETENYCYNAQIQLRFLAGVHREVTINKDNSNPVLFGQWYEVHNSTGNAEIHTNNLTTTEGIVGLSVNGGCRFNGENIKLVNSVSLTLSLTSANLERIICFVLDTETFDERYNNLLRDSSPDVNDLQISKNATNPVGTAYTFDFSSYSSDFVDGVEYTICFYFVANDPNAGGDLEISEVIANFESYVS